MFRGEAHHAHPRDHERRRHGLLVLVLVLVLELVLVLLEVVVLVVLLLLVLRREAQVAVAHGVDRATREGLGDEQPLEAVRLHALQHRLVLAGGPHVATLVCDRRAIMGLRLVAHVRRALGAALPLRSKWRARGGGGGGG